MPARRPEDRRRPGSLLLTVFYFVIIGPFALVVRVATDPLALKRRTPRGWRPLPVAPGTPLERARRQS